MSVGDQDKEALRARLLSYPGATRESVERDIFAYDQREVEKRALLERGFSNALAEAALDRKGYPRPPGWYSVFFYPGSLRPRNRLLFIATVLAALVYWFVQF